MKYLVDVVAMVRIEIEADSPEKAESKVSSLVKSPKRLAEMDEDWWKRWRIRVGVADPA